MYFYGGFNLLYIISVFAIIGFIAYLLARPTTSSTLVKTGESSIDIAKKRYARGEISKEELDEIKRHLL